MSLGIMYVRLLEVPEPGFSFNFFEKENETLRNACTEVTSEDDSDVCNLGSLNFARIDDLGQLKDVVQLATKFLLCGTLRAQLPYDKIKTVREKNRRLGAWDSWGFTNGLSNEDIGTRLPQNCIAGLKFTRQSPTELPETFQRHFLFHDQQRLERLRLLEQSVFWLELPQVLSLYLQWHTNDATSSQRSGTTSMW